MYIKFSHFTVKGRVGNRAKCRAVARYHGINVKHEKYECVGVYGFACFQDNHGVKAICFLYASNNFTESKSSLKAIILCSYF